MPLTPPLFYVTEALGILLDQHIYWKFHINSLCNNLTKIVNVFKITKTLVPFRFKSQFIMLTVLLFPNNIWDRGIIWCFIKKLHTENLNNAEHNAENTICITKIGIPLLNF